MEITSRGDLTTGQTPPAARAAKHPDRIDATPVPLVASASSGGGRTRISGAGQGAGFARAVACGGTFRPS